MSDFTPLYRRIMNDIKHQIKTGELAPGQELPSTRELADRYDVSHGTVREAINRLIESDWLRGHQGLGVFVKERT